MYENIYAREIKNLSAAQWELLAHDILWHLGFQVLTGPSTGQDQGMDLVVSKENIVYLVSCKHYLNSGQNVGASGPNGEINILDRMHEHCCAGFIPFYSTGPTSSLKKRLEEFKGSGIPIIEFYADSIFNILPYMHGFTLQKYFPNPQEICSWENQTEVYKPLICLADDCGKNILASENIPSSMVATPKDGNGMLHFLYGCKSCLQDYVPDGTFWEEIEALRYNVRFLSWCAIVDWNLENSIGPAPDFYKNRATLQEGMAQISYPTNWGRWPI